MAQSTRMAALHYLLLMAFAALLVAAAVSDLVTMRIPNRIPLMILALFPLAAWAAGLHLELAGWHVLVGLLGLAIGFCMFALNWVGGGDAKLAAAIALWMGPFFVTIEWALLAAIYGGGLTLLLLAVRRVPLPGVLLRRPFIARLHDPREGIPYGIALAAAALTVYPSTNIFVRLAV